MLLVHHRHGRPVGGDHYKHQRCQIGLVRRGRACRSARDNVLFDVVLGESRIRSASRHCQFSLTTRCIDQATITRSRVAEGTCSRPLAGGGNLLAGVGDPSARAGPGTFSSWPCRNRPECLAGVRLRDLVGDGHSPTWARSKVLMASMLERPSPARSSGGDGRFTLAQKRGGESHGQKAARPAMLKFRSRRFGWP